MMPVSPTMTNVLTSTCPREVFSLILIRGSVAHHHASGNLPLRVLPRTHQLARTGPLDLNDLTCVGRCRPKIVRVFRWAALINREFEGTAASQQNRVHSAFGLCDGLESWIVGKLDFVPVQVCKDQLCRRVTLKGCGV